MLDKFYLPSVWSVSVRLLRVNVLLNCLRIKVNCRKWLLLNSKLQSRESASKLFTSINKSQRGNAVDVLRMKILCREIPEIIVSPRAS